jgi:hypothetical protein
METKNIIGTLRFEMDKKQLDEIASTGKLGVFVEKATELFRHSLKAELVNSVASGSVSLVRFEDDEYGTGPKGPFPHVFAELEAIASRMKNIEVLIKQTM